MIIADVVLTPSPPIVHLFGPFDPSGASSLPADAVSCAALGCHALGTVTSIVVRDTANIEEIHPLQPELIDDQARSLLEDMPVQAVKVGALHSLDAVSVVAQIAADYASVPLVVQLEPLADESLLADTDPEDLLGAVMELLLPLAHLAVVDHALLQQWRELGILPGDTGGNPIAQALLDYNPRWVLVNGMPLRPGQLAHMLYGQDDEIVSWPQASASPRVLDANGPLTCAILAQLAQGRDVRQAIESALPVATELASRQFQPGMGNRLIDRTARS